MTVHACCVAENQIRFALRCTAFSQSFGSPRSRVQRVSCLLSPVFMSYKWKPFSRIIFHCQRCQKGEASAAHHPDNVIKTRMINQREEDACVCYWIHMTFIDEDGSLHHTVLLCHVMQQQMHMKSCWQMHATASLRMAEILSKASQGILGVSV